MKKVIVSMLVASMVLFSCSGDDSVDSQTTETVKDDSKKEEKSDYKVLFTQKGDIDNVIVIVGITAINDGVVASKIIDTLNDKNLGNPSFINMHEKEEGKYSYVNQDKTEAINIVVSYSIDKDAKSNYEFDLVILKDNEEVYNEKHSIAPGTSITQLSLTY